MSDGRIKINELPETNLVKDDNNIKEHKEIADYFIKQSAVHSANGIAPLDSSQKIPHSNLTFGTTENTISDGALGKKLSDNLSSHLSDTNNPHTVTKAQLDTLGKHTNQTVLDEISAESAARRNNMSEQDISNNEIISDTEPDNQNINSYWLLEYE